MSNRNRAVKGINMTKNYYRKQRVSVTVDEFADHQDAAKVVTRQKYKFKPFLYKNLEREIDSEYFRLLFPAGSKVEINGEKFNELASKVYKKQLVQHKDWFNLSKKANEYAMIYIIDVKEQLFPSPEGFDKFKQEILTR